MTKILYVEDNPDNVYMLTRRLKKKGFELSSAGDGQEGIDKAIEESPDLILMDLSLPTMDGWTATAEIKKIEEVKDIPIIALSAHAMPEHRDRAIKAGCSDYDTKPVDIKRLLSKMGQYIELPE
jgi:two-component system cell cycle response regulator DivK